MERVWIQISPQATWKQSHSTLTAFATKWAKDGALAEAAWDQFFNTDGYAASHDWTIAQISSPDYLSEGEEAKWITTNEAARYSSSAISNLANSRTYLL